MNQKKSLAILDKCLDGISKLTQEEFDVKYKMIEQDISDTNIVFGKLTEVSRGLIYGGKILNNDHSFYKTLMDTCIGQKVYLKTNTIFIKKSNFKEL